MVHDHVESDVSLDEDSLQFSVSGGSLTAGITWQHNHALADTHAEWIESSEPDSGHHVGFITSVVWDSLQSDQSLAAARLQLTLDGETVWFYLVFFTSSKTDDTVLDVSHALILEGTLKVADDVIDLVHYLLVAWSFLYHEHDISAVGDILLGEGHILSLIEGFASG